MRRQLTRRFLPMAVAFAAGLVSLLGCACASAAAPPSIESESAAKITPTGATLEAQINPGDAPVGVYYQFQIATDLGEHVTEIICPAEPSSGPAQPCVGAHSSDALPIGFVAAGSGPSSVSLDLSSAGVALRPGTTYYFRVVVARAIQSEDTIEWEAPSVVGDIHAFMTPSPSPPTTYPEPQLGGAGQPAAQPPSLSPTRRRHRHHRRHNRRGPHRSRVSQASLAV
jgi:hypothetical protein